MIPKFELVEAFDLAMADVSSVLRPYNPSLEMMASGLTKGVRDKIAKMEREHAALLKMYKAQLDVNMSDLAEAMRQAREVMGDWNDGAPDRG